MPKVTRQPSGVVAGTMDLSRRTTPDVAQPTAAGDVLARRKLAKVRAQKAEKRSVAKKKKSTATKRTTARSVPRTKAR